MQQVHIDPGLCKACGICLALCSKDVLEAGFNGVPDLANPSNCTGCRVCELHCPDFAISIEFDDRPAVGCDEETE